MNIAKILYLSPILMLTSCNLFNGNIVFRNTSNRDIWVSSVEGFPHAPPVGILSRNDDGAAYSRLGSMKMPSEIVVYWSHTLHDRGKPSTVSLAGLPNPKGDEELEILFGPNEAWLATTTTD